MAAPNHAVAGSERPSAALIGALQSVMANRKQVLQAAAAGDATVGLALGRLTDALRASGGQTALYFTEELASLAAAAAAGGADGSHLCGRYHARLLELLSSVIRYNLRRLLISAEPQAGASKCLTLEPGWGNRLQ